jgi:hypothetical protein
MVAVPSEPQNPKKKKVKRSLPWGVALYYIILFGAGCILVTVVSANVIPYRTGVTFVFNAALPAAALSWSFVIFLSYVFGFLIFGMFQALEILPDALVRSKASVLLMLDEIDHAPTDVKPNKSDSPMVAQLKESLSRLPEKQVKVIFRLKTIAYFFDGIFCFFIFPPFVEGAQLLGFNPFTDVQWVNVALMALTLLAFEQVIKVIWNIQDAEAWIKAIGGKSNG